MERLRSVLAQKSAYLARVIEVQAGIEESVARRFVQIAGADLIESYCWQKPELELRDLADPCNTRDLLSGAYAGHIAHELGLPRSQVWAALRLFVPRVLQLANITVSASDRSPPSMTLALRWSRPATAQTGVLLHPLE
jgi:hypothetical protein